MNEGAASPRVVSLIASATEIVCALGLQVRTDARALPASSGSTRLWRRGTGRRNSSRWLAADAEPLDDAFAGSKTSRELGQR